jgi:hypothetical protein
MFGREHQRQRHLRHRLAAVIIVLAFFWLPMASAPKRATANDGENCFARRATQFDQFSELTPRIRSKTTRNGVRLKANFVSGIRRLRVVSSARYKFFFLKIRNRASLPPSRLDQRGVSRSSRT